jgi:UDPglucose 6-dehydrogenase
MQKAPLFYGLSHIGQVFSLSWSQKIGSCSVYDSNASSLKKFKNNLFTNEEPDLKELNKYKKYKVHILKNKNLIKENDVVFFSIDTPLDIRGKPILNKINKELKELIKLCKINTKIIFLSQVNPGFIKKFTQKNKIIISKKIQIIYMVDTLKMGEAIDKFLKPRQLIFGTDKKNVYFLKEFFRKFKCEKFFFTHTEAETIKMSINLYLAFSVSFANSMDFFCKKFGFSFSKIINPLRNDDRIGKNSYIMPSLGFSGGHLERDIFYLKKISPNPLIKKIFANFELLNDKRKNIFSSIINKKFKNKDKIKILILGGSYKQSSFSMVNSIYSELLINKKKYDIEVFDYKFDLTKNKLFKTSIDLKKSLQENSIYIFNYLDGKNKKILINHLNKNKKKFLININVKENNFFHKMNNSQNIFDVPLDKSN